MVRMSNERRGGQNLVNHDNDDSHERRHCHGGRWRGDDSAAGERRTHTFIHMYAYISDKEGYWGDDTRTTTSASNTEDARHAEGGIRFFTQSPPTKPEHRRPWSMTTRRGESGGDNAQIQRPSASRLSVLVQSATSFSPLVCLPVLHPSIALFVIIIAGATPSLLGKANLPPPLRRRRRLPVRGAASLQLLDVRVAKRRVSCRRDAPVEGLHGVAARVTAAGSRHRRRRGCCGGSRGGWLSCRMNDFGLTRPEDRVDGPLRHSEADTGSHTRRHRAGHVREESPTTATRRRSRRDRRGRRSGVMCRRRGGGGCCCRRRGRGRGRGRRRTASV